MKLRMQKKNQTKILGENDKNITMRKIWEVFFYSNSTRIENKLVVYSGRKDELHYQSVVLFCSVHAASYLVFWKQINERFLVAQFKTKKTKMSVVVYYAPTEVASREEKDTFHSQLQMESQTRI